MCCHLRAVATSEVYVCMCRGLFSLCHQSFTEEEMKKFEDDNEDYYDYEYDEEGNVIGFKTKSRESSKSSEKQEHPSPPGRLH